MHILITANSSWNIANYRTALIDAFLEDGHAITVVAPDDGYRSQVEQLGCHFVPVVINNKGLSPIDDGLLILRLWRMFRAQKPDIILSFTIKNNIYGAIAARFATIPFLPNVSGLGTAFKKPGLLQKFVVALYRIAFSSTPAVFFQNGDDQAKFSALSIAPPERSRRLPGSGIDLEGFPLTGLPDGVGTVFLLIARMLWDKGVGEFVEAARELKGRYPQARFQLLGFLDVENSGAITRATMKQWEDEGVIEYMGTTDDVRSYISESDCVVLPSAYGEGTPRALLEAAAMGRPLITTRTAGCRDTVEEGVSGFLCAPENADSLRTAMEAFLALKPNEREAMGARGREKMEREFDQALVVAAYRKEIAEVVEG